MDTSRFSVDADSEGMRLDAFLARASDGVLSRSRVKAVIENGNVSVDGVVTPSPKQRLREGDKVEMIMPPASEPDPVPEAIPLVVAYEDDDLIVVDKPAGLVVHPGPGNWTGTLVNALLHHCGQSLSGIGGVKRPGIVHRLDKDTSGLLVVAKSDTAHRGLAEQFAAHGRDGRLERAYLACVWGVPSANRSSIEAALGRSASDRTKRAVVADDRPDARRATTHYRTLSTSAADPDLAALVECRLETGRTHQIRVHMAHIGHPLVGDDTYGAGFRTKANRLSEEAGRIVKDFGRQALHAGRLGFDHPLTGAQLSFNSALPADMAELASALGIPLSRSA